MAIKGHFWGTFTATLIMVSKGMVSKSKYSQHWVLKPPSVRGVEVAKASAAAKARV